MLPVIVILQAGVILEKHGSQWASASTLLNPDLSQFGFLSHTCQIGNNMTCREETSICSISWGFQEAKLSWFALALTSIQEAIQRLVMRAKQTCRLELWPLAYLTTPLDWNHSDTKFNLIVIMTYNDNDIDNDYNLNGICDVQTCLDAGTWYNPGKDAISDPGWLAPLTILSRCFVGYLSTSTPADFYRQQKPLPFKELYQGNNKGLIDLLRTSLFQVASLQNIFSLLYFLQCV